MKKFFLLILFCIFVLSNISFGIKKYEVLVSDYRGLFASALYKSEGICSDFLYKFNSYFSFGASLNVILDIPIYGYSGYIEESVQFWNAKIYGSFVDRDILGFPLGTTVKFSYENILDYREISLSVDLYSLANILDNISYFFIVENFNLGLYTTKYVQYKLLFDPVEFKFDIFYRFGDFKFLIGVLGSIDFEFFVVLPAVDLGLSYYFYPNFEVGVGNTFRVGNLLNLELFFDLLLEEYIIRAKFGFGYINGINGGMEFFVKI
ncbi:MAG: hypothetical protein ACK4F9_02480 [Brevinematia bacterium]